MGNGASGGFNPPGGALSQAVRAARPSTVIVGDWTGFLLKKGRSQKYQNNVANARCNPNNVVIVTKRGAPIGSTCCAIVAIKFKLNWWMRYKL